MKPSDSALVRSDRCGLGDLLVPYALAPAARSVLSLGEGWTRRWSTQWRVAGGPVVYPVRDLEAAPVEFARQVHRFTWRPGQRHRPGLGYLVATGRHHGAESLEEGRLLLALEFAVDVAEVLSQPFRLRFHGADGTGEHVPDYLAFTRQGEGWLLDVRPRARIKPQDAVRFAAAAEVALAAGWRYTVVAGWRRHVFSVIDALSQRRRELDDPLGLEPQLLTAAERGPIGFGELVAATAWPVIARAHAIHLLWHRQLGVDLGRPLGDGSLVWLSRGAGAVR